MKTNGNKTLVAVATPYHGSDNLEQEIAELKQQQIDAQNPDKETGPDLANQDTQNPAATSEEDLTYKKRWADLKAHYDRTVTAERNRIKELEDKLKAFSENTPPKTPEELEAFKASNPEAFNAMQAMLTNNTDSERLKQLEEQLLEARQEKAIAKIKESHPDFIDIISSKDWNTWLEDQPESVKGMIDGNVDDAASFIKAINLFKVETNYKSTAKKSSTPSAKKSMNSSAADAVNVSASGVDVGDTNKRIWTVAEIENMSMDVYEQYADEISKARREGRVRN